jgi:hypothetical protein
MRLGVLEEGRPRFSESGLSNDPIPVGRGCALEHDVLGAEPKRSLKIVCVAGITKRRDGLNRFSPHPNSSLCG